MFEGESGARRPTLVLVHSVSSCEQASERDGSTTARLRILPEPGRSGARSVLPPPVAVPGQAGPGPWLSQVHSRAGSLRLLLLLMKASPGHDRRGLRVGWLQNELRLPRPQIRAGLRILQRAGLVRVEGDGRYRLTELGREGRRS